MMMTMWLTIAATLTGQTPVLSDVGEAVRSEFAVHDLNGDGTLSRAEFGAWMAELRAKGGASAKADAPETRTWVTAAFARADGDRNAGVTETELTTFLTTATATAIASAD